MVAQKTQTQSFLEKPFELRKKKPLKRSFLEKYFRILDLKYYSKILPRPEKSKVAKCCTVLHLGLCYEVWQISRNQFQASFGELVADGRTPIEAIEKCAKEVGAMGITGARVVKS